MSEDDSDMPTPVTCNQAVILGMIIRPSLLESSRATYGNALVQIRAKIGPTRVVRVAVLVPGMSDYGLRTWKYCVGLVLMQQVNGGTWKVLGASAGHLARLRVHDFLHQACQRGRMRRDSGQREGLTSRSLSEWCLRIKPVVIGRE